MPETMKQTAGSPAMERLAAAWCRLMHDAAMWPAHGQYECRSCGRHYQVPWEETGVQPRAAGRPVLILFPDASRS